MAFLPSDPEERQFFLRRLLTDTGFFARQVLDMHTDRDENGNATSEIGKGGIRDYGPHATMIEWFDNDIPYSFLWAPRYSYKSSAAKAYLPRKILAHPNISILLYMHDLGKAEERCANIRDLLLNNEKIQEIKRALGYPEGKGPTWTKGKFIVPWREDDTLSEATLTVASPKKPQTGGRFNIILFDDIVSETSYQSEAGRKSAIHAVETSLTLGARGTTWKLIGTPYHTSDANHWVRDAGWVPAVTPETVFDVGVDLIERDDGKLDVHGEARWPNLPKPFLRRYLQGGMTFPMFMSQFKLKVVAGLTQAFQRHHFNPEQWHDDRHRSLTGYMLTDVAPSGSPKGDFNVLAYVGIDEREHIHLLDLEVGYWKMYEFCRRYLAMIGRWSNRVNHRCELWEDSPSFHSYHQHILFEGRKVGHRPKVERQKRNQNEKSKDQRIAGLQVRFQAGEFHVMDTVKRTWSTGTESRTLWDPEGFDSGQGNGLPSGDLVDWFVRFPTITKKDVPDCIALVDAIDRTTETRICYHIRPSSKHLPESVMRKAVRKSGRSNGTGSATRFYDRVSRR